MADTTAHPHPHGTTAGAFLGTAFWVAVGILALETAGGLTAHSLALLSDAGHMLTDVLSLGLAWYATRLALRPPTPRHSYGYQRAGILAALFNAGTLIVVSGGIIAAGVRRLLHPTPVDPWLMAAVAACALCANLYLGLRLHGGHTHNLNVRSAWLHVMGDAAASAGVLVAGGLIALTGHQWWDPLVSLGIAGLIARGAWQVVTQTLNVLMEGAPRGLDPAEVAAAMEADDAVLSVHHLHVWSLDGERAALSGHVVLRDSPLSQTAVVLDRLGGQLRRRFHIDHTTLQLETGPCPQPDCRDCHEQPAGKRGPA